MFLLAALTLTEASKLSQDKLLAGIIAEFITVDNFSAILPFVPAGGKSLVYNRELTDPKTTVGYLDINGTPVQSQATVTQITVGLGRIGGDALVDNFNAVNQSAINDQMAVSVQKKARGVARKFSEGVIKGTGTFPQFSGINTLVDSSNQWKAAGTTTAGGGITFALLDELIDLVTADGDMTFLLMEDTAIRAFKVLMRALNGGVIETVERGWLNPITGVEEVKSILSYEGIPIFKNNNITAESTYGSTGKYRVTAGVLGEEIGLTGIMPGDADPGIRMFDIGQKDSVPAQAMRLEMHTGLALYSTKALSQLVNMVN